MTTRWKRKRIKGNDDKFLVLHQREGYTITLNNNHGKQGPGQQDTHGDFWQFEVTCTQGNRELYVGEAPTLAGAKRLAATHEKR